MLPISCTARNVNKPTEVVHYKSIEELSADFNLEGDDVLELYEGKEVLVRWAKRNWMLTVDDP